MNKTKHRKKKKKKEKKNKKKKKAWDLGSSRNHLSSFIYHTFNTKIFIYHASGNQDTTVYMSQAIDVARQESTDLAIATAIGLRRSDR